MHLCRIFRPQRSYLLLRCPIHGSHYYDCLRLVKANRVRVGESLKLKREPDNEYDTNAIEVFNRDGDKLGYVPKNHNLVIATLMDQGCRVTAFVDEVQTMAWDPVSIGIEWRP